MLATASFSFKIVNITFAPCIFLPIHVPTPNNFTLISFPFLYDLFEI